MNLYQAGRVGAVAGAVVAISTWIYFLSSNRVGEQGFTWGSVAASVVMIGVTMFAGWAVVRKRLIWALIAAVVSQLHALWALGSENYTRLIGVGYVALLIGVCVSLTSGGAAFKAR